MQLTHPLALGLAGYLGFSGYRKGSLSLDGAIAAFGVGYVSMASPFIGYGLTLITFYLTGSKATKFKAQIKSQLETHATEPTEGKRKGRDTSGGDRSAVQVLCNSLTAVLACIAYRVVNAGSLNIDPLSKNVKVVELAGGRWEVTNLMLTLIIGGHYAACMGDTLASELGILSQSQPRLVTNPFRKVPKGTNGGISALGFAVSALGGTLIGLTMSLSLYHFYTLNPPHRLSLEEHFKLIALLTASGLAGSLLDSLLGATLQQTLYNPDTKKVLVGQITDVIDGKKQDEPNANWVKVTGWNVLSNNAVNLVASAATALLTAFVGVKVL